MTKLFRVTHTYFFKISSILAVLLVFVSGCRQKNDAELNALMKNDEVFRHNIQLQNKVESEILFLKNNMMEKKRAMDASVEKLRSEYDAYARTQNAKIEKLKSSVDAKKRELKSVLEQEEAILGSKNQELSRYQKNLAEFEKVLNQSQKFEMSEAEKAKWQDRIEAQKSHITPLSAEIEKLKNSVQIKKKKLSYLGL